MLEIGRILELEIIRFAKPGAYLLCGNSEVLLPNAYLPDGAKVGERLSVFLYTDSDDRPIATTLTPKAQRGEIALLKVVDKNDVGIFLDLGIAKDVFMPTKTPQNYPLSSSVLVFLTIDRENRLIATDKIKPYLLDFRENLAHLRAGSEIGFIPFRITPLGFECVINGQNLGLLHNSETAIKLERFKSYDGFIKRIYKNGKCDISLKHPKQKNDINKESKMLLDALKKQGGILKLHYDSPPELIKEQCTLSKKGFKRALSSLLAQKVVQLEAGVKITLIK